LQFNINAYNSYYFVGIGGISMSSLALILKRSGKEVKGYDRVKSDATQSLEAEGITVYYETTENNCKGCDIAVFTAAIASDNPEMKYINEAGIPAISRAAKQKYGLQVASGLRISKRLRWGVFA